MKELPTASIPVVTLMAILAATVMSSVVCSASCIPFDQARNHLGEAQCVTGTVVRVKEGTQGVHYLDFCEDYRLCTFTVVVFPHDLKRIGDVRQLAGKTIAIRGEIKEYDSRAEIILDNVKQLGGNMIHLSPLPKNFDVEQRGHFSAGSSRAKTSRASRKRKVSPTLPAAFPEDSEAD
jgi:DNA/RNA endonuclease YhcR with UshA esterase domain